MYFNSKVRENKKKNLKCAHIFIKICVEYETGYCNHQSQAPHLLRFALISYEDRPS